MKRRAVLGAVMVLGAPLAGLAHTPYRQWKIYRLRHLLVGTSREDAPTYPLGQEIVAVLATHLPESSPRVTRARGVSRLASLLSTDQIPVVLLSTRDARAMAAGARSFAAFGPQDLRALYRFGAHWLVTRADFPDHHAWMVTRVLVEHGDGLPGAGAPEHGPLPVHPGALAAMAGEPRPAPPAADAEGLGDGDGH